MLRLWRVQEYWSFLVSLILHVLLSILRQYLMGNYACIFLFLRRTANISYIVVRVLFLQTDWIVLYVLSTQKRNLARQKRLNLMPIWRTWLLERTAPKTGPKRSSDKPRCCFNPTQVRNYTGVIHLKSS